MPIYDYACPSGHRFSRFLTVAQHQGQMTCEGCPEMAVQVLTAPVMVKARPDICYDSPIDGRPITSWHARQEDLKRNGCQEYDPEMKTDYQRRIAEGERSLDRSIEQTVEAQIEQMPGMQRQRLYNEITRQGADLDYTRSTKGAA